MKIQNRELIEDLIQKLTEQEQSLDRRRLEKYKPHPGQLRFHKSNKKIRLICSGNRYGKTTCSVIEAVWLALGIHPYHPIQVPNRGKIYGESYSAIMESIKLKIDEWVPMAFLDSRKPVQKNQLGQIIGINFNNGSFIRFGTYDQDESKSESSNWHYVAFDEPPPRALYIANMRGLVDFGGIMWFSMTPLSEPWIFDELYEPGLKQEKSYVEVFDGSSYDNPYLPKEALELFKSELTEDEVEVRIHGKFRKLKGLVIDTYDPFMSDIEPFTLDHNFSIYEGIDPHSRKPNAVLWKAVDKDQFRYAVAELSADCSIYELGQRIAEVRRELRRHGAQIVRSVSDTSLNQKDMMFKINQKDELYRSLRDAGENLMPQMAQKKDWLGPGIQKLRDIFRPIDVKGIDKKVPMEYLFNGCVPRYKYELGHYQWPTDPLDSAKPVARHNEYIDCSRYIESVAPVYETPGTTSFFHAKNDSYKRLSVEDRLSPKPKSYVKPKPLTIKLNRELAAMAEEAERLNGFR